MKFIVDIYFYEYEKIEEKKAWQLYLMRYQNMTKDNYKPFEFIKSTDKKQISKRSTEDILKEAKAIESKIAKQKRGDK